MVNKESHGNHPICISYPSFLHDQLQYKCKKQKRYSIGAQYHMQVKICFYSEQYMTKIQWNLLCWQLHQVFQTNWFFQRQTPPISSEFWYDSTCSFPRHLHQVIGHSRVLRWHVPILHHFQCIILISWHLFWAWS